MYEAEDDEEEGFPPQHTAHFLHKEYAEAVGEKVGWRVATEMLEKFADAVEKVSVETKSDEAHVGAEAMRKEIVRTARTMAARLMDEQGVEGD